MSSNGLDHDATCYERDLEEIRNMFRIQRSYANKLKHWEGDMFESRTDISMMIDRQKKETTRKISQLFYKTYGRTASLVHAAAALPIDAQDIRLLIEEYPNSVRLGDLMLVEALPLHLSAAATGSNHSARLAAVLAAHAAGAGRQDQRGRLPLHYALYAGAEAEAVRLLVGAHPGALGLPLLPLRSIPDFLPRRIIGVNAEASMAGFLPLHVAAARGSSCAVIYELLRANPSVLFGSQIS